MRQPLHPARTRRQQEPPPTDRKWTTNHKIGAGAGILVIALVAASMLLGDGEPLSDTRLLYLAEKTTTAPGLLPEPILERAREIADEGGGTLDAAAVAEHVIPVEPVSLSVEVEHSRQEDPTKRRAAIDGRLKTLGQRLAEVPVSPGGHSLYAALQWIADEAVRGPVEVWWGTTVFTGSVEPMEIAKLTNAEPAAAVDVLFQSKIKELKLDGVTLHPVMLTPVGDGQQPLTPASEAWRAAFVEDMASRLGARVSAPLHDGATAAAWPGAAQVPTIPPIRDLTPAIGPGQPAPVDPDEQVLDNVSFVPNLPTLVDERSAQDIVRWAKGRHEAGTGHNTLTVTGFCARFGDADSARALAAQRAETIKKLLLDQGVPDSDVTTVGAGYDKRADPTKDPTDAAQRVVVIQIQPRN